MYASLLHMNGVDASTTFTDEIGKVWTVYGHAQIDTAQKVFGTGSGMFDGIDDYIDTPDSEDFNVGNANFTVDLRIYPANVNVNQALFGQCSNSLGDVSMYLLINGTTHKLEAHVIDASSDKSVISAALTVNTWYHVAIIRNGSTLYLYIDGVSQGSSAGLGTVINSASKFAIGRMGEYNGNYFNGYIDEFRFVKGVAEWTSNFTLPVGEYLTTYYKTLTATVKSTASLIRNRLYSKTLTCTVKSVASMRKTVNKTLSTVVKVFSTLRRMQVNYKPLYPILTVTEYPIEMSVTEYPIMMEVLGMPKAGSTITLKGTFPDSAGNLTLLADVTVKVYGPGRTLLTTISGASVTEVSTGIYTAEYTIPTDKTGQFDFEFSGTLGSKTIVDRRTFDSNWK